MESYADIVGYIGVLCFLVAYGLLQKEKLAHNDAIYLVLNFLGSLLVLFSLWFHWNTPAFLLETAWALISMYGICKYMLRR